jgi:hypothetical protein
MLFEFRRAHQVRPLQTSRALQAPNCKRRLKIFLVTESLGVKARPEQTCACCKRNFNLLSAESKASRTPPPGRL